MIRTSGYMVLYAQSEQPSGINAFLGSALAGMEMDTFKDRFNGPSEFSYFISSRSTFRLTGLGHLTAASVTVEADAVINFLYSALVCTGGLPSLLPLLSNPSSGAPLADDLAPGTQSLDLFGAGFSLSFACFLSSGDGTEGTGLLGMSTEGLSL